jgi:hypothetical protein
VPRDAQSTPAGSFLYRSVKSGTSDSATSFHGLPGSTSNDRALSPLTGGTTASSRRADRRVVP